MRKAYGQLVLQTTGLVAAFMIWVLLAPLLPFIREEIPLSAAQAAWATAVPVVLGSLLRVPFGYLAGRFGARAVFTSAFLFLAVPLFILASARTFRDLLSAGFLLGVAGALFSVGVTSLPRYFAPTRHGLVNGVYGMGNIGTAATSFLAPILARAYGWAASARIYVVLAALFAVLCWLFGDRREAKEKTSGITAQLVEVGKRPKLWLLSLFYFVTFGSFVAFTVYLPQFLVDRFGVGKVEAGFSTAVFIAVCTLARPVGGWLADRKDALTVLAAVFAGMAAAGVALAFSPTMAHFAAGCLLVAVCAGIGNGAVFKLVPAYFRTERGTASGVVAMFGGLGGFFPPLVMSFVQDVTGHFGIGFMALSEFALAAMILALGMRDRERLWLYRQMLDYAPQGVLLTDARGVIRHVNPAFSAVTGYAREEAVGRRPNLLKSGVHDRTFYENMWRKLQETGRWCGEIWNKRKNGELYPEWLTIGAIRDESGDIRYYVGMFSDLTDYRRGERRAEPR